MRKPVKLVARIAFLAFLLISARLCAWGPISHIALTYESGIKNGFPVSSDLVGAYLAGSTEPDIGLDDGKSEDYGVYHSEDFAKAMETVAQSRKSPDRELLLARAAGLRSHLAGDSSAHGQNGYSDAKIMFPGLQTGLPVHTTNELCVDMIMYDRNRSGLKNQSLNFMNVDTLIAIRTEYSRATGKELKSDRESLKKELLNHRAMVLTELSLANHLSISDPAKLKQMRDVYSDLATGATGGKGTDLAIARIAEQAKPMEDLSSFKAPSKGSMIKDFLQNSVLAKSFQALERGVLKLTRSSTVRDSALDFAEDKVSTTRNKAFVNFGINLLNRDLTFKQAAVLAGKNTSGYPENAEQKMAYLQIEAEALKSQRDKALAEYNSRPWWKFWLIFSKADQKRYEELEARYQLKLIEIKKLNADTSQQMSSDTAFAASVVESSGAIEGAVSATSATNLSELQAKVDAAYKELVAATDSQNEEALKTANAKLLAAQKLLKAAMQK